MANEYAYRADHIGPLIIPDALADARKQFASGAINLDQLRDAEEHGGQVRGDMPVG